MKFKIKKILTPKQLWRAKWSICVATLLVAGQFSWSMLQPALADEAFVGDELMYKGKTFTSGFQKDF